MLRRLFERWGGGARRAPSEDPLQTYDRLINELERQGTTFRQGAATLLSLRTELREALDTARAQSADVEGRLGLARGRPDARAVAGALEGDLRDLKHRVAELDQQLARADADAALLLEGARAIQEDLKRLQAERDHARHTLTVDHTVSTTLRARVERLEASPMLEAARDEVTRAHALAEIYRGGG
ncbi:MAG TPA: hypothetical protein VK013_15300 [Myxococcaceae bacterium]|nr:hypothetical protein [Myxococcaceae bacterium]